MELRLAPSAKQVIQRAMPATGLAAKQHDRAAFTSRQPDIDDWFRGLRGIH
jgi:hypothetical protein